MAMDAKKQAVVDMLVPPVPTRNPQRSGAPVSTPVQAPVASPWRDDPAYATPHSAYVAGQAIGPIVPGTHNYIDWANYRSDVANSIGRKTGKPNSPENIAASYDKANARHERIPTPHDREVAQRIYQNMGVGNPSALAAVGWRNPGMWNISPIEKDKTYTAGSGGFSPPKDDEGKPLPAHMGRGYVNDMRTNTKEDSEMTTPMHEGIHAGIQTLKSDPRFRQAVVDLLNESAADKFEGLSESKVSKYGHPDDKEHAMVDPITNTLGGQQYNFDDKRDIGHDKRKFMKEAASAGSWPNLTKDENGVWHFEQYARDPNAPKFLGIFDGVKKTKPYDNAAALEFLAQQYLATIQPRGPR